MQRNVMTWATILLAVGAVLGAIVDVFPAANALRLAEVSIAAGAAGRALVFVAKEISSIYTSGGGDDDVAD